MVDRPTIDSQQVAESPGAGMASAAAWLLVVAGSLCANVTLIGSQPYTSLRVTALLCGAIALGMAGIGLRLARRLPLRCAAVCAGLASLSLLGYVLSHFVVH